MTDAVEFIIPGPAVGKGRARLSTMNGHARMHTPAKTVNYETLVAISAQAAMQGRPLFDQALDVRMHIACVVPASWSGKKRAQALAGELIPTSKPDLDNVAKAICDGLNGVLWRDDVLVTDLQVRKRYALTPGVYVAVRPCGNATSCFVTPRDESATA